MENSHHDSVITEIETLKKKMEGYKGVAHMLTPFARTSIDAIPQGFSVSIRARTVSRVKEDGEVYKVEGSWESGDRESDVYALTKLGLQNLAQLAGVEWVSCYRSDDAKDPHYCSYKVAVNIIDVDGSRRNVENEYSLDLRDGSERVRKLTAGEKPKLKQLSQARSYIGQYAESNAKSRAIRELLGIAPSYTKAEIIKPFVILKVNPIYDMNNPIIQAMVMAKHLGAEKELFGILQAAQNASVAQLFQRQEPAQVAPAQPMQALPPAPESHGETEVLPPVEEAKPAFDKDATIQRIQQLYLKKKGTTRTQLSPGKPSLAELNEGQLITLENALKQLPDFPF
jgi:hypothetical protein